LVACFPWDARSEKGIGSVEFEAADDGTVTPLALHLDALAEIRARYVDQIGSPIEGIQSLAAADPLLRLSVDCTRGTVSDGDGWSTIYVRPGATQYVMGADERDRGLVESEFAQVTAATAQQAGSAKVTMVPAAFVEGHAVTADAAPVAGALRFKLHYADGTWARFRVTADGTGRFLTKGGDTSVELRPGIAVLAVTSGDGTLSGAPAGQVVLVSGEVKDLGTIVLKDAARHASR
jgi:hypothetical protein